MTFTLSSAARLRGGHRIPLLGLGVYQNYDARSSVLQALEAGCRHIDSAQSYRNEEAVGKGIAESGISREDIFVSKGYSVESSAQASEETHYNSLPFGFSVSSLASKVTGRNQGYQSALKSVDKSLEKFGLGESRFRIPLRPR